MEATNAYIARDRHDAMAFGRTLRERAHGAAVFADISGFTPLTEALTRSLGPRRGVEELTGHLNRVYDALVGQVHEYGGTIINFAGDAITCWFDGDDGRRAVASGLAMQGEMGRQPEVRLVDAAPVNLSLKVGIATGSVRRFAVGDPSIQLLDVLAGDTLSEMARAANAARKGEVAVTSEVAAALGEWAEWSRGRSAGEEVESVAVVSGLRERVAPMPWPASVALADHLIRPWLLPAVFDRLRAGRGEFLTELRPAVALFLKFGGIDYDGDDAAGEKLDAFVRWIQRVTAPYEGFLHHVSMGDKGSYLYCTFGAPIAHEDDAERALAAALELRHPPKDLGFLPEPRIGMSHGTFRTGAYGGVDRRTYGVLGDEVNLAARLMEHASPGEVLASGRARDEAGEGFVWEPVLPLNLKGKSRPVPVYRLVERRPDDGMRLMEPGPDLPMVGRRAELARLASVLAAARGGQGRVVEIVAEAGMGKSRLVGEAIRAARGKGFQSFGGQAQSFGTNTSYLAWWSVWRGYFGIRDGGAIETDATEVAAQLMAMNASLLARLPLLGAVLNLPLPENDTTRSLDAKLRKAALEGLLVECVRHRARNTPLLIVLEDAHWLDPLSRDLADAIARGISSLPVVLLVAARPPEADRVAEAGWRELPHFARLELGELTSAEAEELIRLKLGRLGGGLAAPDPTIVRRLVERSQGNPFYLEELINLLRDEGRDPADPRAWDGLEMPNSLQSLILSRMDRLSERQKPTLKVASIIGRVFEPATISAIYPGLRELDVREDLSELVRLELASMERPEPELAFIFKHVVMQEVAYETLPFATRERLHGELGLFLERRHAEAIDQQIDLLAFHFDRSDRESKRREYLLRAGQAAQARYANAAAISYYRRALPLLTPAGRIAPSLNLGRVLETTGDWAAAAETYRGALALAGEVGDQPAQARCRSALGELHRKQGDYPAATRELEAARAIFKELGDELGVAQTLHFAGSVAAQQGNYDSARTLYLASLETRRRREDHAGVASLLSNLGIIAWFRGNSSEALRLHEEALSIRRQIGSRWAIGNSLNNLGLVLRDLGDVMAARRLLEECLAINREIGDRWSIANALGSLADVALSQGDHASARAFLEENIRINGELGDRTGIAFSLELFAQLCAARRQPERALRLAGAARSLREAIGAPLSPAEQERHDRSLEAACAVLAPDVRRRWAAEGSLLSPEEATSLALDDAGETGDRPPGTVD